MSQENVDAVWRLFDAYRKGLKQGDLTPWFDSEYLADDFEWVVPPGLGLAKTYRGRDEYLDFIRTWTEDFKGWSVELEEVIDAGADQVVGLVRQTASGRGSGVPVELKMAVVYELAAGRVVRIRNYMDRDAALEAVGLRE